MTVLTLSRLPSATPELRSALAGADLPVDDLDEPDRVFFRADMNGAPIGFGGFELLGNCALLRSIVVLPEQRRAGMGRQLAEAVLSHAHADGASSAYLLTTTAAPFFGRLGFQAIERASAPATILATREATALCPSTATLMSRSLEATANV